MFEHVEPFGGDPILSLNEDFQKDPRPGKINLSIGIYFDDAGRIPVLDSVRRAEQQVVARDAPKPYLPIEGAANFRARGAGAAVRRRPRGGRGRPRRDDPVGGLERRPQGRRRLHRPLASRQRRSGSATRAGRTTARCSKAPASPSHDYPYYDGATGGLAFEAMCKALRGLPAKSVVLLHACCHNPTGVDLTPAQWDALVPILAERELRAVPRPRLPGLRRRHRRGRLRGARARRGARPRRPAALVLRRQLVLEEHEPVRRALRRAQRRLRRRAAKRRTSSASSSSRCAATTRARRSTAARSSPPCSTEPALRRDWEAELGGDARAHPGDAPVAARRPRRQDAGSRLRLLPEPARHVQLHRPVAAPGRSPARGVRGLPACARGGCASPASTAATSRRPRRRWRAVLAG